MVITFGTSGSHPRHARVAEGGGVGCGESKAETEQVMGDSAMHTGGEGVADEATEHCQDGKAARVTLRLVGLWKQVCSCA